MPSPIYTAKQLNSEVWCRLGPSKIHGVGVFAIRDIPTNTIIQLSPKKHIDSDTYNLRIVLSETEWKKVNPEIRKIILDRNCYLKDFDVQGYEIEHPNTHQEFICFMNHSDNPNSNGYSTNRIVKAGEEITEKYYSMQAETVDHMIKNGTLRGYI